MKYKNSKKKKISKIKHANELESIKEDQNYKEKTIKELEENRHNEMNWGKYFLSFLVSVILFLCLKIYVLFYADSELWRYVGLALVFFVIIWLIVHGIISFIIKVYNKGIVLNEFREAIFTYILLIITMLLNACIHMGFLIGLIAPAIRLSDYINTIVLIILYIPYLVLLRIIYSTLYPKNKMF